MTDIVELVRELRDNFESRIFLHGHRETTSESFEVIVSTALSEARATGRREGMEEAAKIADDMPILQQVTEKHLRSNKPKDVAAAIRAAMEK